MPQPGTEAPFNYEEDLDFRIGEQASKIDVWVDSKNIAEDLDQELLDEIGQRVVRDFELDLQSMSEWREDVEKWTKLATLTTDGGKGFPFSNASDVKYPLLAMATVQFSARTYPIIVQGDRIAKSKVLGADPTGEKAYLGDCIDTHMNYQLLHEMEEWEEDTDSMLAIMPTAGCGIKKTYYGGQALGRNVSEFVPPLNIVLPYYSNSFKTATRITEILELSQNDHVERVNADIFLDIGELGPPVNTTDNKGGDNGTDIDAPHKYLEQHRWWDLDDDGYQEPYVITVHKNTGKVVRITARWDLEGLIRSDDGKIIKIKPNHYYTQYVFMPSPDGGVMGMGFGKLLGPINDVVDSIINQLLDAGTRSNTGGGFIGNDAHPNRGQGGQLVFEPGEYKPIDYSGDDIRKAIVPLTFPAPSNVLFSLLGLMIDGGQNLSTVNEAMTGGESPTNEPATTRLSRVEQGMKVFSAIQKRIYRSLKHELKKLHRLNRLYLDEEVVYRVNDKEQKAKRQFYENKSLDVLPVADPNEVSDTQKRFKAEALMGLRGQGLNDGEINLRFLEALGINEPEKVLNAPPPPPDPKVMIEQEKLAIERDKLNLELMRFGYEMVEIQSKTIKNLAEAEAKEVGPQLEIYKTDMQNMMTMIGQQQSKKTENPTT